MAEPQEPTFAEAFQAALGKMGFAKVKPGEMPTGRDLLAAVGGIRGLIESLLPGLAFLVTYSITAIVLELDNAVLWSVTVPVALAIIFLVVRLVSRQSLRPALSGILVAVVTGGLALFTGRAQDSFVPGIIINAVSLTVFLVSIIVRWPLIGFIVGALTNDLTGWRKDLVKRRILTISSWLWVGLFAIRLAVEVPLYLASQTSWLAGSKLFLGVPFYALMLWVTWLLVGTVFASSEPDRADDTKDDTAGV